MKGLLLMTGGVSGDRIRCLSCPSKSTHDSGDSIYQETLKILVAVGGEPKRRVGEMLESATVRVSGWCLLVLPILACSQPTQRGSTHTGYEGLVR